MTAIEADAWADKMFGAVKASIDSWEPGPMDPDYVPVDGDAVSPLDEA